MALINCPECGKEISNKAKQCIHCGYPIEDIGSENTNVSESTSKYICKIDGKDYDFEHLIEPIMSDDCDLMGMRNTVYEYVRTISIYDAGYIVDYIRKNGVPPKTFKNTAKQPTSIVCPKCGSPYVATGARGVNGFWGFIGASKTVNRCQRCGHTWKPRR